jgi:hypothetical protein
MTDELNRTPAPSGDLSISKSRSQDPGAESARATNLAGRISKTLDAAASPEGGDASGAFALGLKGGFLDSPDLVLYVQHALEADLATRDAPIDIVARAGTITLLGNVESDAVKYAAERAARSVAGVSEVDNQLVLAVGEPVSATSDAAQRDTTRG